ncbi:MAG: hypothetical protein OXR66_02310 [Candidatus Woesearchaeota archaeon]|nr:hypothetical protein [Candidatus Woesearchaeota archaeon]
MSRVHREKIDRETLEKLTTHSERLQDVLAAAVEKNLHLVRVQLQQSERGRGPRDLEILSAREDYALVTDPGSGLMDGDIGGTFLLPYGASEGYTFSKPREE